jgi:hypothetical protein
MEEEIERLIVNLSYELIRLSIRRFALSSMSS